MKLRTSSLNEKAQQFLFFIIVFLHLMFLHTFFDASLFPDLKGYTTYFDHILDPKPNVHLEIGWYLLNRILYSITHNSFILIFSVSLIIIVCYLITIERYSAIPWLSVFLLLCTVFYNSLFVLRQNLAIPICLLSIPYIIERKPVKFTLITLLAVSFHYSALIWFLAYFIYPIKINVGFYFIMITFSVLFYFMMEIILKNLVSLTTKIMAYTVSKTAGGTGILKSIAVHASTLILSLYSFGNHKSIKGHNKLFFQLTAVIIFLNLVELAGSSFTLFSRLNLYLSVPGILLIPNALANIQNKKLVYILIPVICFCYLFILRALAQYGYGIRF
jgi:hypothetical protein